jgi:hypothetical protein
MLIQAKKGEYIETFAFRTIKKSKRENIIIETKFNDIDIIVTPESTIDKYIEKYMEGINKIEK